MKNSTLFIFVLLSFSTAVLAQDCPGSKSKLDNHLSDAKAIQCELLERELDRGYEVQLADAKRIYQFKYQAQVLADTYLWIRGLVKAKFNEEELKLVAKVAATSVSDLNSAERLIYDSLEERFDRVAGVLAMKVSWISCTEKAKQISVEGQLDCQGKMFTSERDRLIQRSLQLVRGTRPEAIFIYQVHDKINSVKDLELKDLITKETQWDRKALAKEILHAPSVLPVESLGYEEIEGEYFLDLQGYKKYQRSLMGCKLG